MQHNSVCNQYGQLQPVSNIELYSFWDAGVLESGVPGVRDFLVAFKCWGPGSVYWYCGVVPAGI